MNRLAHKHEPDFCVYVILCYNVQYIHTHTQRVSHEESEEQRLHEEQCQVSVLVVYANG